MVPWWKPGFFRGLAGVWAWVLKARLLKDASPHCRGLQHFGIGYSGAGLNGLKRFGAYQAYRPKPFTRGRAGFAHSPGLEDAGDLIAGPGGHQGLRAPETA